MQPPRGAIVRFVAIFLSALGILLWPWQENLGRTVSSGIAGVANVVARGSADPQRMHFQAVPDNMPIPFARSNAWYAILYVPNEKTGTPAKLALNLRPSAYVPTCVFVCLALASPIWTRKDRLSIFRSRGPRVLAVGLAIVGLFVAASIVLPVVAFLGTPPLHVVELGSFAHSAINLVYRTLFYPPGMSYAVPVLVWAFVLWLTRPNHQERRARPAPGCVSSGGESDSRQI